MSSGRIPLKESGANDGLGFGLEAMPGRGDEFVQNVQTHINALPTTFKMFWSQFGHLLKCSAGYLEVRQMLGVPITGVRSRVRWLEGCVLAKNMKTFGLLTKLLGGLLDYLRAPASSSVAGG